MKTINIIPVILLFAMAGANIFGQIPNPGFEDWIDEGTHLSPEGWWTPNDSVQSGDFYPVTRSTDHYPPSIGEYALRMENNIERYPDWASVGLAWTGEFRGNDNPVFPVSGHPTSLWGYFKFLPQNSDTFEIHVRLYKEGEDVGGGSFKTADTVTAWTPFQVMFSDYVEADSARILFSSCYDNDQPIPHGNSVLFMDNLNFDELITAVISEVAEAHEISVYPNPASDQLILSMEPSPGKMVNLSVFDVLGRMILTQNIPDPAGMTTLDISTLPAGNYLLRITADHRTALERKIIVLR